MKARIATYNQYPDILTRLDLQPVMKRLVGCAEGQTKARRLDEIERLRFASAAHFTDKLVLRVASLASRVSNVGDVIARLVVFAFRASLDNSAGAVEANDVEVFGDVLIVISVLSAGRRCNYHVDEVSYLVHRRRLRL